MHTEYFDEKIKKNNTLKFKNKQTEHGRDAIDFDIFLVKLQFRSGI